MKLDVKNMSYSIYPIISPTYNSPVIILGIGYEDNQPHILRREGFPIPQIFIYKSGEGTLNVNLNGLHFKCNPSILGNFLKLLYRQGHRITSVSH